MKGLTLQIHTLFQMFIFNNNYVMKVSTPAVEYFYLRRSVKKYNYFTGFSIRIRSLSQLNNQLKQSTSLYPKFIILKWRSIVSLNVIKVLVILRSFNILSWLRTYFVNSRDTDENKQTSKACFKSMITCTLYIARIILLISNLFYIILQT